MISLRPYQSAMIDATRELFRRRIRRVLLQLGTGGGKTALASRMLHGAVDKHKRVWFCCHRRELVKQISQAFDREGMQYGIVAAGAPMNPHLWAQVCSIPTLAKRWKRLPKPDVIVLDECHHVASKSWAALIREFPEAYVVGLSATPCRLDGRGLADFFDEMVCGPSVAELIEQGFLSDYRLFAPQSIDRSGLHKKLGDFVAGETVALVNKPTITGNAIQHYKQHCDGARAIAFCASIEHSKAVVKQFNEAGVPALHIDGETDTEIRDAMLEEFRAGTVKVLSNVEIFSEGFDVPSVEAAILLRPTASLALYLQQVGRALRPAEGKKFAVIMDHVGNSHQHGFPDDYREWKLTGNVVKDKKTGVPSPRVCGKCFGCSRAGSRVCKLCGHPFPVEAREVDHVDGELAEAAKKTPEQRRAEWAKRAEQVNARSLEALIELGIKKYGPDRGPRWANYVHQGRMKKAGRAA